MPQMCSGTRWLSSYDRALEKIDANLMFNFSFLSDSDRDLYRPMMKGVLESHNVEKEAVQSYAASFTEEGYKGGKTKKTGYNRGSILHSIGH